MRAKVEPNSDVIQRAEQLLPQLSCGHANATGGNDYILCNDCDLMWDYRRERPQDLVVRQAGPLISDLLSVYARFQHQLEKLSRYTKDLEADYDLRTEERNEAVDFIARNGYQRCDGAACNCNSWHGGHMWRRFDEIENALRDADVELNGVTVLAAVNGVLRELAALRAQIEERRTGES